MMQDIAPGLLRLIQKEFEENFSKSEIIARVHEKIWDATATYLDADSFALEVGEILANAYQNNLSSAVLPDRHMYYNIADRIITPTLTKNHELITGVASDVQTILNKAAGIGIKALVPEINQDRIKGLIEKAVSVEDFDDVKWILDEPVKNHAQSIVTDSIQANAEFHYKSGMSPKIIRTSTGSCCEWCRKLEGAYKYPDVPKDIYHRHDYCRCTVDYLSEKSSTNVHNGNHGKRRYAQDEYGRYRMQKESRKQMIRQRQAKEKKQKTQARQKRIENSKEITEKELSRMSIDKLRALAEKEAVKYYGSGLSGISFGGYDVKEAARQLARNGTRASLKKDIMSMHRKNKKMQ